MRAVKAAKLPRIRFHDLRHTHATLLLERDTPDRPADSEGDDQ